MEINDEFKKDAKEAVDSGVLFGYCPARLMIEGRDELQIFSLNILFSRFRNEPDGSLTMGSALYDPDPASLTQDREKWSMVYRNQYGGDSYVVITIKTDDMSYRGDKFVNGLFVGSGIGKIGMDTTNGIENGWKMFFFHLTMLGLTKGEKCEFEKVMGKEALKAE